MAIGKKQKKGKSTRKGNTGTNSKSKQTGSQPQAPPQAKTFTLAGTLDIGPSNSACIKIPVTATLKGTETDVVVKYKHSTSNPAVHEGTVSIGDLIHWLTPRLAKLTGENALTTPDFTSSPLNSLATYAVQIKAIYWDVKKNLYDFQLEVGKESKTKPFDSTWSPIANILELKDVTFSLTNMTADELAEAWKPAVVPA